MSERLIDERRRKVETIREQGENPFANDFKVNDLAGALQTRFDGMDGEAVEAANCTVSVGGRVIGVRSFGKVAFARLIDRSGEIQLSLFKLELSDVIWKRIKQLDIGRCRAV